jgi:hypothetical protein
MSAVVREKIKGSGDWWIFVTHQGRRVSKRIGPNKNKALAAADIINIRLTLSKVGLDLSRRGKKAPPLLKLEHISELKARLAKIGKRARASEIPLWAVKTMEHRVLWEDIDANREGREPPVYTREKILEAAVELVETYGTERKYDQAQIAKRRLARLLYKEEIASLEAASRPSPYVKPDSERYKEETREEFPEQPHEKVNKLDSNPSFPSQTGHKENVQSSQAESRLSKEDIKPEPRKEHILYEKTRKRKEYKEALRKRYSLRNGYRWK